MATLYLPVSAGVSHIRLPVIGSTLIDFVAGGRV